MQLQCIAIWSFLCVLLAVPENHKEKEKNTDTTYKVYLICSVDFCSLKSMNY